MTCPFCTHGGVTVPFSSCVLQCLSLSVSAQRTISDRSLQSPLSKTAFSSLQKEVPQILTARLFVSSLSVCLTRFLNKPKPNCPDKHSWHPFISPSNSRNCLGLKPSFLFLLHSVKLLQSHSVPCCHFSQVHFTHLHLGFSPFFA